MSIEQVEAAAETLRFPEGFRWGAATAAYQIEGAAAEDGRGPSIWDTFARTPGRVSDGHTGDVACDHYHRYRDDVALMARAGRRHVPVLGGLAAHPARRHRAGQPARPGLLRPAGGRAAGARASSRWSTLYHWDLPQALEDRGGWTDRDTAERFAEYAAVIVAAARRPRRHLDHAQRAVVLGVPRLRQRATTRPGRTDRRAAFAGRAPPAARPRAGRAGAARGGRARAVASRSTSPGSTPQDPADPHDVAAARRVDGLHNRIFLDPVLRGAVPADVLALFERFGAADAIVRRRPGASSPRRSTCWASTTTSPRLVAAQVGARGAPDATRAARASPSCRSPARSPAWAGRSTRPACPTCCCGCPADYPGTPLMVTENGAAYADARGRRPGRRRGPDRLPRRAPARRARGAIEAGADLRGYFAWSLLDNFEWAYGYDKRFGLVHVDYDTQRRIPEGQRPLVPRRCAPARGL